MSYVLTSQLNTTLIFYVQKFNCGTKGVCVAPAGTPARLKAGPLALTGISVIAGEPWPRNLFQVARRITYAYHIHSHDCRSDHAEPLPQTAAFETLPGD